MAKITKVPNGPLIKKKGEFKGSTLKSGGKVKKAQGGGSSKKEDPLAEQKRMLQESIGLIGKSLNKTTKDQSLLKSGGMIKRADGSYSKRGLWDNIRANKGSGKKPTKQMLVQEKKIKAKTKK